ncbi:MAG TPA: pyrroline-5-carboxylate reductase [Acidimicrobiales bacterium]|jgi:pyrroline-5-carboxylate reductase|nr:pyrroline-5-carboxylate reductase [Acidimicrobiales bacterium]
MAMPKLQVIGGGKMGEALLAGLIAAEWAAADELQVVEKLAPRADELRTRFPGVAVVAAASGATGHVVAVKPGDVEAACAAIAGSDGPDHSPVLSIAAGVTIARLEAALPPGTPVVRAMPNTPSLVGAGAAAIAAGHAAYESDLAWAEQILGAVGSVARVDEPLLDAVTGLSGSGPAYVFLVIEAMIEAGVLAGLPRPVSTALAVQTVTGAAKLIAETGDTPEVLRAAVTSPGGTTAAGLRSLERSGVRAAFLDAVMAATERSRELGR